MYSKTTALTKIPIDPTIFAVIALSWFFEGASCPWVAVLGFLAVCRCWKLAGALNGSHGSVSRGQRGLGTVALPEHSVRTPGEINVDWDGQHGVAVTGVNSERAAGPGRTRRYRTMSSIIYVAKIGKNLIKHKKFYLIMPIAISYLLFDSLFDLSCVRFLMEELKAFMIESGTV
jgi:hypothetical protein